ncbi:hypothetical protein HHK36_017857 [Tetracentron sinense]|uniref:Uncharacterized protein n=1 Tax=Tetracentron sinense TaxID=13715 RepID=A0A835DCZ3_TETSI|nr:hypothetical protein HHK36_017857 [Tetracentron sinense]
MSSGEVRRVSCEDIQLVQNLIEQCLQLYMNKKEVVQTVLVQAKMDPVFTELVWQKLEEQNPEFFKAYHLRLMVRHHIMIFNNLLEKQVELLHTIYPDGVASVPNSNGSRTSSCSRLEDRFRGLENRLKDCKEAEDLRFYNKPSNKMRMRIWSNGKISLCQGEDAGSIPKPVNASSSRERITSRRAVLGFAYYESRIARRGHAARVYAFFLNIKFTNYSDKVKPHSCAPNTYTVSMLRREGAVGQRGSRQHIRPLIGYRPHPVSTGSVPGTHQTSVCYAPEHKPPPSRPESMHHQIGPSVPNTLINGLQNMHTADDISSHTRRMDVPPGMPSTQNSQMGMTQGMNGILIKSEAGYSSNSSFTFGVDGEVLEIHPETGDASVAQPLNDPLLDTDTSSFGFLRQNPRNFSLSELTTGISHDILESYYGSPYLATDLDNFPDYPANVECAGILITVQQKCLYIAFEMERLQNFNLFGVNDWFVNFH